MIIPLPNDRCPTKLVEVYWIDLVRPFSLRPPFVHGLFVSWGATGWWFVINSRANIYVTIDCATVLPLVLGVVTRQKPHINGSVVLGADESPWPCGNPSWYTPLSWMILSKQKDLHLFSSQYICVFSKTSIRPSVDEMYTSCHEPGCDIVG